MKKLLFLFIPLLVGIVLFLGYKFILSFKTEVAALQVTSTPQTEVFLDDNSLGKTPLYSERLIPGEHILKLKPQGSSGIPSFEERIILRDGILTVVDRSFKSSEAESEMSIISLEKASSKNAIEVAVVSSPDGSEVALDEQPQGITPLILKGLSISDHQITIAKTGYSSKTLRVAPKEGYRLTIFTKQAVSSIGKPTPTPQESPEASESATVKIGQTPTGFLRVRSGPSTTSKEIARVNPSDILPLIDEREGWYRVRLPDGIEGWISSQYSRRDEPE